MQAISNKNAIKTCFQTVKSLNKSPFLEAFYVAASTVSCLRRDISNPNSVTRLKAFQQNTNHYSPN